MYAEIHSPAALLLIHVDDERLFGETELVFPLSSIVVQSFDCTLKHTAARKTISLFQVVCHVFFYTQPLGSAKAWKLKILFVVAFSHNLQMLLLFVFLSSFPFLLQYLS